MGSRSSKCFAASAADPSGTRAPGEPGVADPPAPTGAVVAFEVVGAGVAEANGVYNLDGSWDRVPSFRNSSGMRLLRYRYKSGRAFWLISRWDLRGPTRTSDDLYRTVASESATPPPLGWLDRTTICGQKPGVVGDTAPGMLVEVLVRGHGVSPSPAGPSSAPRPDGKESKTTWDRWTFEVTGAGDDVVDGLYLQSGFYDGVPQYLNDRGVTLLRYRFRQTGKSYWFLSLRDKDGDDKKDRDLYRSPGPSNDDRPPNEWIAQDTRKPIVHGTAPAPRVTVRSKNLEDAVVEGLEEPEGAATKGRKQVAVDMSYPTYWTTPATVSLEDNFSRTVAPSKTIWAEVDGLLKQTFTGKSTRDRKGQPVPKSLTLRNLFRVESSSTWNRYAARRGHIMRTHCPPLPDRAVEDGGKDVLTKREGQELVSSVNEFYLWHGTKPSSAMSIAKEGFLIDLAGSKTGAAFGQGAYFAEASSKADEYAEDDEQEGIYTGLHAMLLCRVVCGRTKRFEKSDKKEIRRVIDAGECDAVLADREALYGTYREFVIFDAAQVYPEYVFLYAREFE